jgi:formate dehydrogenase subunit gamma
MSASNTVITRYSTLNRVNHWINAICFVLMVLSGLSMFHPMLFFLSSLFGGGQWTRAAHPWIGVVLLISYSGLVVQFWRENLWNKDDFTWLKAARFVVANEEDNAPPVGTNNAGQKIVFWSMTLLIPVLFFTGLVIWEVYFGQATSIHVQRAAVLIHSMAAIAAIIVWIVHVYAAIWVRGSMRAMTQGYVTPGWAWRHHRKWLEELADGQHGKDVIRKRP